MTKKILILAANPLETARLRLDKEVKEIRMTLQLSPNRDRFVIESHGAVRPQDLQTYLFNLNPHILHFSGHGGGDLGLAFEDEEGNVKEVNNSALAGLFKLFTNQIQCVVLNACYAAVQAKTICQHIPYAIGMNQAIGDEAARKFAEGFYRAIWDDRSIEEAFDSGVNAIALEGIPEELTPVLLKRSPPVLPPIPPNGQNNISKPASMSKAQQLKLQYQQKKLADLENKVQKVQLELEAVLPTDILTKDALENRLNILFEDIAQMEQKIQTENKKLVREKFDRLSEIFQSDEDQKIQIQQAYQNTLSHWSAKVKRNVDDVQSMVDELIKISQSSLPYSALDEFIANLFKEISDIAISNALAQWGKEYCQNRDWMSLYEKIQESQDKRLEKAQPAIVITITRSDEASTQSQDGETYYQLESWLIEDIDIYQTKKTGFHSLLAAGSPDNAPCLLEEMLQNTTHLLDRLLSAQRNHCQACENYPEIHVFLPLELMHLDVDTWLLEDRKRPKYLGHDHLVFIHCANRYDGNYRKMPSWKKLWKRHQGLLQESALNVFVEGHDSDLDELMEILDDAVLSDRIVGLQVIDAPVDTESLVYELLDSGVPIALWSRTDLAEAAHQTQVKELLAACCLATLPSRVKDKRAETRKIRNPQNQKEVHIGHHLSLLWDDPYFYPPKSA